MSAFNDLLDSLGGLDGAYPESLLGDLMGAYDADTSIFTAKIGELDAANAELNTMVSALKAQNYDLLVAGVAGNGSDSSGSDASDSDKDSGEDDPEFTIDDMFGDSQ